MSGGTRCNITQATDNRGIVSAYGPPGKFLHSALAAFSVQNTIDFFEAEGVPTKVEETGKVFPVSNKAVDVLQALLSRLHRSGATLALAEPVTDFQQINAGFAVKTPFRVLSASSVLLTTGGKSYPGSGTTGDGYAWAANLGHTIIPPRPALVPIRVAVPWIHDLRGITLPDVSVAIMEENKELARKHGSLLFAHFGLSGPVILDISRVVTGHAQPKSLQVQFDFLPKLSDQELDSWLRDQSNSEGKKQLTVIISELIPRRLADALIGQSHWPLDRRAGGLTRQDRSILVEKLKHCRVPIDGALGFEKAEVTAGGIALSEVDSRTMESKICPGLFLAGEILDLDGPIGGYNFQAAWSTGWLAGKSNKQN
jgi:predicted Rossmann fold flavoprotein